LPAGQAAARNAPRGSTGPCPKWRLRKHSYFRLKTSEPAHPAMRVCGLYSGLGICDLRFEMEGFRHGGSGGIFAVTVPAVPPRTQMANHRHLRGFRQATRSSRIWFVTAS
jgi:hypothetical protein